MFRIGPMAPKKRRSRSVVWLRVVVVVVLGLLACHSKRIFPPEYNTGRSWEMLN